jgi:hypothetical protein
MASSEVEHDHQYARHLGHQEILDEKLLHHKHHQEGMFLH